MDNLELAKVANEVRKGVLTAVHGANPVIREDRFLQQISLPTCILKK